MVARPHAPLDRFSQTQGRTSFSSLNACDRRACGAHRGRIHIADRARRTADLPCRGCTLAPVAGTDRGFTSDGLFAVQYFPDARGSGVPQTKAALFAREGHISLATVFGNSFAHQRRGEWNSVGS